MLFSLQELLLFAPAALVLVLTPGPNMVYCVSRSLTQGPSAGLISLTGVVLGFVGRLLAAALGLTALREAIARLYHDRFGANVAPDRIIVTPGASGALMLALAVLTDPGDEWLLPDPGYPSNRHLVRSFEGVAKALPVDASSRFQPTPAHVEAAWTPRTRGLVHRQGRRRARARRQHHRLRRAQSGPRNQGRLRQRPHPGRARPGQTRRQGRRQTRPNDHRPAHHPRRRRPPAWPSRARCSRQQIQRAPGASRANRPG